MLPQFFRRLLRTKPSTTAEKTNLTAADFDPYDLEERPLPPLRFSLMVLSPLWMATAIILGRLVLQGLGWGFFAAVKYRRQIPLPFSSAVWVKNNTHSVTHITTLIATFLSGFSTLWSTLIAPVVVVVSSPLVGSEVDLASPNLQQFLSDSGPAAFCFQSGNRLTSVEAGEAASGFVATSSHLGHLSMLTALDKTFNRSTGWGKYVPESPISCDGNEIGELRTAAKSQSLGLQRTTHVRRGVGA
ncbi:hypothetical protein C8J57DRAFT_1214159 [Mycena rebaudengoi]|nr:hypothetical protein C8J57DRAFT_1214159 [Mycena rebaudengoi]